ncbi:PREDICTED: organic solute transporter alpha-like protein 3 [Ceratosolen solmsi marchali]|uniref:Organic solute transporter alpha-like protein 3 n=1 Tax=Ceratosolen solmsi marchali TaxID=326594 RepID=A0AAJ6YC73_9HYME|nr:PREDICTED: organic solute transporter alpha-like protein 3 [Ceratosolen solmsi marchali]
MAMSLDGPFGDFADGDIYFTGNFSCGNFYLPSTIQLFESLGNFGVGLVTIASIICAATVYLAVDACQKIYHQKETTSFKINASTVLSVYPIASFCSLMALALPRSQLLAEALIQVSLTLSFYRLFKLLVEVGRRKASIVPGLMLRVGPCCCWPCLPLPSLEMSEANLFWLRLAVLQFPIVQGLVYCIFLFMSAEAPIFATTYGVFLQPLVIISILLGIYGLTVVTKSLQDIDPESCTDDDNIDAYSYHLSTNTYFHIHAI